MKDLDPVIESFYMSILAYAGLKYDSSENCIVNINPKFGEFTVNGKKVTLPYAANLKHPNGRSIFHLLNENYLQPESPLFLLYKKRLVCELNSRLTCLIISLVNVANSIDIQNRLTNGKIIDIVSAIKNSDMTLIENVMAAVSKSKNKNDEAFIFDVFLKKSGEINGTPYSAVGKIVFNMPKEVEKSLATETKDNHVYGAKLRISDLKSLSSIFKYLFGGEKKWEEYQEGTDNKVFRYLNVLLTTSYLVAAIINEIAAALKETDDGSMGLEELTSPVEWAGMLTDIYKKSDAIRSIPNQDEFIMKDRDVTIRRVEANEGPVRNAETFQPPPVANAQQHLPVQQPYQPAHQAQVPMQPPQAPQQELSVDDWLKAKTAGYGPGPVYYPPPPPQQYQQPNVQHAPPPPRWMGVAAQQPVYQQAPQFDPRYPPPQRYQQPQYDQFGRPLYQQQAPVYYDQYGSYPS
jgi:hypothetical protein